MQEPWAMQIDYLLPTIFTPDGHRHARNTGGHGPGKIDTRIENATRLWWAAFTDAVIADYHLMYMARLAPLSALPRAAFLMISFLMPGIIQPGRLGMTNFYDFITHNTKYHVTTTMKRAHGDIYTYDEAIRAIARLARRPRTSMRHWPRHQWRICFDTLVSKYLLLFKLITE